MTYPTIRPSLTLDFSKSKQLDPRIGFSRSSTATYVEGGVIKTAPSNFARFEKDGLLIESGGTNYIDESVDLTDTGTWSKYKFETPTLNAGTAPDGTNAAASLIPSTDNSSHSFWCQNISTTFSGTLTVSVFAKANGYSNLQLSIDNASAGGAFSGNAVFDLSAGTVTQGTAGTGKIQSFANGWYRCSVTHTNTAQSFTVTPAVLAKDSSVNTVFTGDGTSGYLLWGFQLEAQSFASSYIPTAGSTVTRAADVAQITGTNFSSWYNPNATTIIATQTDISTASGYDIAWGFRQDASNRIELLQRSGATRRGFYINGGNIALADLLYTKPNQTDSYTVGVAIDANGADQAAEGTSIATRTFTNATMPTIGTLYFSTGSGYFGRKHISRLSYYNQRLTDSQLQELTS